MKKFQTTAFLLLVLTLLVQPPPASAIELDWSGWFTAESYSLFGYSNKSGLVGGINDPRLTGYFTPQAETPAHFQSLFLKLNPSLLVNDNVTLKTEWWVGSPGQGFFGSGRGTQNSDRSIWSTQQSAGSKITAQRFYVDISTDLGTVTVGRAPLNWGLGVVWKSDNTDPRFERLPSTGDQLRLNTKLGSFFLSPAYTRYSYGFLSGEGTTTEYSLQLRYQNTDEQSEFGVQFARRVAAGGQSLTNGTYSPVSGVAGASSISIWDIYGKKSFGPVTLGLEIPLASGTVDGRPYDTVAAAAEADWKISGPWTVGAKLGRAPGQPNAGGPTPTAFKAFNFHPDYRVGLIMFNLQMRGLTELGDTALGGTSLYYNPIVNANYVSAKVGYEAQKWKARGSFLLGSAVETAGSDAYFYNTWNQKMEALGGGAQGSYLGLEVDTGVSYIWDDHLSLHFDTGLYFPGAFYEFSNTATLNPIQTVFGAVLGASVNF